MMHARNDSATHAGRMVLGADPSIPRCSRVPYEPTPLRDNAPRLSVLLVEDNLVDAHLVTALLDSAGDSGGKLEFDLTHVSCLADGIRHLSRTPADAVLLGLSLPDDEGVIALAQISRAADVPIVVLTDFRDERVGIQALQAGAQDYLTKGAITRSALARSLQYAVERHRWEQTRRHLEQVEAALRDRDEFLAIVAHELRTPITTLRASVQLAQRQLFQTAVIDRADVEKALGGLDGGSLRLLHLSEQILEYARVQSGTLHSEARSVDVVLLAHAIAQAEQLATPDHPVRVEGARQAFAVVDSEGIGEALRQLLHNAQRFSPADAPVVVRITLPTADALELTVRDRGAGIQVEHRSHIFERHFQSTKATRHSQGLGLGLYISRALVEQHGGTLTFESPPDGGACFVMRLPRGTSQHH